MGVSRRNSTRSLTVLHMVSGVILGLLAWIVTALTIDLWWVAMPLWYRLSRRQRAGVVDGTGS